MTFLTKRDFKFLT